jgi:hypothetical protein
MQAQTELNSVSSPIVLEAGLDAARGVSPVGTLSGTLKDRLYDCLPAGRYALSGLLRLVDVVETEAVPTAAVECHAQPRLLVNPAFVAQHAATPEKLMMLVLHEIHHVLLGHTRRLAGPTPADNFVFDAVINALLCRLFPQPAYTALFRDFYPDDALPACLLRPPEGWDPRVRIVPVPPALQARGMGPARQVYTSLYSPEGASYEDVRHVLRAFLQRHARRLEGVRLLGDHEGGPGGSSASSQGGGASASADAFAQGVADIVSRWPSPPEPLKGVSLDDMLRDSAVRIHRVPSARRLLRELITRVAAGGTARRGARRWVSAPLPIETPIPTPDRRATTLRALGAAPLLFRSEVEARQRLPVQERVHVYVDVSGSMEAIKGPLYGAVLDCEALVHPQVHLFSTQVAEVTPAQLRAGICRSTGGTDIQCVTRHMARHRVRRAVLLTDGWVGNAGPVGVGVLQAARIGVGYLGDCIDEGALAPYADATVRLPIGG